MRAKLTALAAVAMLVCAAPLLTACAGSGTGSDDAASPSHSTANEAHEHGVTIEDGWAKAAEDGGMTGVFGTLVSTAHEDLVITGVESDDAEMIELHEVTADGVMQKIEGDVVIPAEGTYELAPGANHIMLMGLTRNLLAGDEVSFTLHLSSESGEESTAEFTVLVKDYAGANENYGSGETHADSTAHATEDAADGHDEH